MHEIIDFNAVIFFTMVAKAMVGSSMQGKFCLFFLDTIIYQILNNKLLSRYWIWCYICTEEIL